MGLPDLHVMVRDDIAVTWGLNRMCAEMPDGKRLDLWSRGTRIFHKRDGEWLLIHQHVSFSYDPATGMAKLDLAPTRSAQ